MQTAFAPRNLTLLLVALSLLGSEAARAQQATPKMSVPAALEVTYDYVRTNGPPGNCGCINLNGGGVAYVHPLSHSNFAVVGRLDATHAGSIGALGYDLTLLTYTAGARYTPRLKLSHFQPYGEIEVGGAYASGSLAHAPSLAGNGIRHSFAGAMGGGVDLKLRGRISFKLIDAEYLSTNYANGDTDHQNDLRLSGGVVFSLRSAK